MSDTPKLDKLYDMVSEREGPCFSGAPSKWSYEAILDLTDFARTLERENAALTARVTQLKQRLEINRAVLAGARNCILKYVPVSIQSDRDFTLGSIKLAIERGAE